MLKSLGNLVLWAMRHREMLHLGVLLQTLDLSLMLVVDQTTLALFHLQSLVPVDRQEQNLTLDLSTSMENQQSGHLVPSLEV
jgi:hypothetical protein